MRTMLVLFAWCLSALAASAQSTLPYQARLDELRARIESRASDDAVILAESVRDDAVDAGDYTAATLAIRLLASMRIDQERFADARPLLQWIQDAARTHGLRQRELEATLLLARLRVVDGDANGAATQASATMATLERLDGIPREQLLWAYAQTLVAMRGMHEYDAMLARANASLRADDRFPVACSLWHSNGDQQFNAARYGEAHESLSTALACYEGLNKRGDAGRVLVSLGRVQRAHGQLLTALDYYKRAARLQEADGDIPGMLQSLNAQAVTYDRLGRFTTSERVYRAALATARARRLERYELFLQGNLGGSLLAAGNPAAGLRELEAVLAREKSPFLRATRLRQIAQAYGELGQFAKAIASLEESGQVVASPTFDDRVQFLSTHAYLRARMGDLDAAQRDLDEAVRMIEDARARVLDGDTTRRGFGELHQGVYAGSIDVAMRRGESGAALELAEQARARALLDLMQIGRTADASQTPPRMAEMQAMARQLDTTLLVYWVDQSSTFAWVVTPTTVQGQRLAIGERALRQLVRVAAGSGNVPAAINAALLGGPDLAAWRSLHRALIAPLSTALPARPGARITVVPHGPLLHLPFAGLLDTRGRYLIERYALHYAPSLAVLRAATRRTTSHGTARAIVFGDPAPLPRLPGVQLPPPLPYARAEARRVARHFRQGALLSVGGAATEGTLRAQVSAYGWLHVATHARVAEETTAQSYLLLARGAGGAQDDGVLTADEVSALPLEGATVVLSACGTALGRVTGEGTLGFTRSFLAAGARAIVATTWEMPDAAGLRVMDAFYAARVAGAEVSEALRTAQLKTLRALRTGTITTKAGTQVLKLPATPLLWAGYIAVGVP
jgi:CHAT domain-containing protein